jgi:hypothetical protein
VFCRFLLLRAQEAACPDIELLLFVRDLDYPVGCAALEIFFEFKTH